MGGGVSLYEGNACSIRVEAEFGSKVKVTEKRVASSGGWEIGRSRVSFG
jgi:hypothetical protein